MRWILGVIFAATILPAAAARALPLEDQLRDRLIETVRQRAGVSEEADVRISSLRPSDPALLRRAVAVSDVQLLPGESGTGAVTAKVHLRLPGGGEEPTWIMARVDVWRPVAVATRAVSRGEVLSGPDVRTELRPAVSPAALSHEGAAVGRAARRAIQAGEALDATLLALPPVLQRGDLVETFVAGHGFRIRTRSEALERGAVGDVVKVKVVSTAKVVRARVLGAGQVELAE